MCVCTLTSHTRAYLSMRAGVSVLKLIPIGRQTTYCFVSLTDTHMHNHTPTQPYNHTITQPHSHARAPTHSRTTVRCNDDKGGLIDATTGDTTCPGRGSPRHRDSTHIIYSWVAFKYNLLTSFRFPKPSISVYIRVIPRGAVRFQTSETKRHQMSVGAAADGNVRQC